MSEALDREGERVFQGLRRAFTDAHAGLGVHTFVLRVYTSEEWREHSEELSDQNVECLGELHPAGGGSYCITALAQCSRKKRESRWVREAPEPIEQFENLASRAGASLPREFRRRLSVHGVTAVESWLSFMWHVRPPPAEELSTALDIHKLIRLFSVRHFLDSAEAIEGSLLALPRPVSDLASKGLVGPQAEGEGLATPAGGDTRSAGTELEPAPTESAAHTEIEPASRKPPAQARAAANYQWVCSQRPDLIPKGGQGGAGAGRSGVVGRMWEQVFVKVIVSVISAGVLAWISGLWSWIREWLGWS